MADADATSKRFTYRKRELPDADLLLAEARRLYAYDETARGLIWREHKNPKRPWPPLGTVAGGDDGHGYRMCLLLGHKFKVHQVVWLVAHGHLPKHSIDHANGDKLDNRIANLRLATDLQNSQNLKKRTPTGVKSHQKRAGFSAVVQHKGKKHHFGYFKTREEANAAYIAGKRSLCGEFSPV